MSRDANWLTEHTERFQTGAELLVAEDTDGYLELYMPESKPLSPMLIAWRITHGIIIGSAACGVLARAKMGVTREMLRHGHGHVALLDTKPDAEPDEAIDTAARCVTAAVNADYAGAAAITLVTFSAHGLAGLMRQLGAIHEMYVRLGGALGFPDLHGELDGL